MMNRGMVDGGALGRNPAQSGGAAVMKAASFLLERGKDAG